MTATAQPPRARPAAPPSARGATATPKPPAATEHFRFLLPEKQEWFTPAEVGQIVGRSPNHIRACLETAELTGHRPPGEGRRAYRIHREDVLLFLLRSANYEPEQFLGTMLDLLRNRSAAQLDEFARRVEALRTKKAVAAGQWLRR